jgi:hypothetical protein
MQPQLEELLVGAAQEIVTNACPIAVGFDAAADEDNWGFCVLILSRDLQSAYMPLLLPQARVNASRGVSPTLICRPSKESLRHLFGSLTASNQPVSVAVDIPFGWPDGHRDFVTNWNAQCGWQGQHSMPLRQDFERRWCDIEIRKKYPFVKPLPVGADTIAQAAFCWSIVQQELRQFAWDIDFGLDAPQRPVALFETYPGAFVKLAASEFGNYKRKPTVRRDLLRSLQQHYSLVLDQRRLDWLEWACEQRGSPDAFDAFLCALTAWDHLRNRSEPESIPLTTPSSILQRPIQGNEADRIRREGWMLVRAN